MGFGAKISVASDFVEGHPIRMDRPILEETKEHGGNLNNTHLQKDADKIVATAQTRIFAA